MHRARDDVSRADDGAAAPKGRPITARAVTWAAMNADTEGVKQSAEAVNRRLKTQVAFDLKRAAASAHELSVARAKLRRTQSLGPHQPPLHPLLSERRHCTLEYVAAQDQMRRDRDRACATRDFQQHWEGFAAVCVRRENKRRRSALRAADVAARVRKAMAGRREAAKERQRKERVARSAAVRAALANASEVAARAQAAYGKRVREVCDNANRWCEAADEEDKRGIKRQIVRWQSEWWGRRWAHAFAARRAGILRRATVVTRQS